MNINFAPIDEAFIKSKVEEGYYSNATELVRDAVRKLREKEPSVETKLRAALFEGKQALNNGDFEIYSPELMQRIEMQARENAQKGIKPNPLVCP